MLVFSEDLDEILEIADRIAVIYEGAIAGEMPASEASIDEIGLMMAGAHEQARLDLRGTQIAWAPFQSVSLPSSGSCSSPSTTVAKWFPASAPAFEREGAVAVRERAAPSR